MRSTRTAAGSLLLTCLLACSADETGEPGEEQQPDPMQDAGGAGPSKDTGVKDTGAKDTGTKDTGAKDTGTGDEPDDMNGPPVSGPDAGGAQVPPKDGGAKPNDAGSPARDAGAPPGQLEKFSFFVTSIKVLRELSKSQNGFGGDFRFGETGEGAGLRGADKLCTTIAEKSMPGSGAKGWRAFLSAVAGPVHAIDRIGNGPWYDREGRVLAMTKADLMQVRPATADTMIKNDLPNEDGVPNHDPDGTGAVDNHHVLTGSNGMGRLYENNARATCNDWTKSAADTADQPRVGLMWPRGSGGGANASHWISAMDESGCAPGATLDGFGGPVASNPTVGSGGGYGAIYCFALMP
jgi:hypothetical protein